MSFKDSCSGWGTFCRFALPPAPLRSRRRKGWGSMERTRLRRSVKMLLLAGVVVGASCLGGDGGDVGILQQAGPALSCPPPPGTRPDPTVINIDSFVLARFPLQRVLNQLITIQGVSQSPVDLYKQLWDTADPPPGMFPTDPHCDDPGAINDFRPQCPVPDAALKNGVPTDFAPTALTNRFDLAPRNGAHCGEYRIVYARTSGGVAGRDFIIFEGVLPNPNPSCGIESCRPVVKFWENLATFDPTTPAGQQG